MRGDVCEKWSVIETRVRPNVGMCWGDEWIEWAQVVRPGADQDFGVQGSGRREA